MVVSSSRLPYPHTTIADFAPNSPSTFARNSVKSGVNTPINCRCAPAGLVSGPRMLKIVRIGIWRRGPIACFMAGCSLGANRNPIPMSSTHRPTCSGVRSRSTPNAASTSALPHLLVLARLPCLAIRTPAPAATKATVVLMLNVPDLSPPVPQVSSRSPSVRVGTLTALARMARALPRISASVSPFMRSPIRYAPICASVASPRIIWFMTASASSAWRCPNRLMMSTARWMSMFPPVGVGLALPRELLAAPLLTNDSLGSSAKCAGRISSGCSPGGTAPRQSDNRGV